MTGGCLTNHLIGIVLARVVSVVVSDGWKLAVCAERHGQGEEEEVHKICDLCDAVEFKAFCRFRDG